MSQYYNPKRKSNIFDPNSNTPFRLSRSKIDLFLNCPRCFYLDRKLGVAQPPGYPFSLNSAVDLLLKKEFDIHRAQGRPHPMMSAYGIDAVPYNHEKINEWRDALRGGITYLDKENNFLITGGIDDVWINKAGELIIVDYKATAKDSEVSLDADWQIGYKRQMEIYQWLFQKNNFKVSKIGYFVYVNGKTDAKAFDAKLEFDVKVIPYQGNDSWISGTIKKIHQCLMTEILPQPSPDCDFCAYRSAVNEFENNEN
ncbi:MAG: PD-(D/E)XK nuclease family protein [Patescibacteria group bacterium]|nr:PD-(D/E)XK nuclease family protein [Patescibacteria group bacterium]